VVGVRGAVQVGAERHAVRAGPLDQVVDLLDHVGDDAVRGRDDALGADTDHTAGLGDGGDLVVGECPGGG
jgi:hypothetical protein